MFSLVFFLPFVVWGPPSIVTNDELLPYRGVYLASVTNKDLLCYRGVYLASVVSCGDRILVTNDDLLPVVEVDENYTSASLNADFHWLMKVLDFTDKPYISFIKFIPLGGAVGNMPNLSGRYIIIVKGRNFPAHFNFQSILCLTLNSP